MRFYLTSSKEVVERKYCRLRHITCTFETRKLRLEFTDVCYMLSIKIKH